jgi:hypothetical protein
MFNTAQTSRDKWVQVDELFPKLDHKNGTDYGEIESLKQTVKQGLTPEHQILRSEDRV